MIAPSEAGEILKVENNYWLAGLGSIFCGDTTGIMTFDIPAFCSFSKIIPLDVETLMPNNVAIKRALNTGWFSLFN